MAPKRALLKAKAKVAATKPQIKETAGRDRSRSPRREATARGNAEGGAERRFCEQQKIGLLAFDYDAAIKASLDEAEKDRLRRAKVRQFADIEERRKRYIDAGQDAEGNLVQDSYKANEKLMEVALREDEFVKMIKGSGLNERLKRQAGLDTSAAQAQQNPTQEADLEDAGAYGDVFGEVHEADVAADEETVVVLDISEGVDLPKAAGWLSAMRDRIIGGTRFDQSGRVPLEQRQGSGKKTRTLLVKPALRKSYDLACDGSRRTVESLRAQGVSEDALRASGWLDEAPTLANEKIRPLGTLAREKEDGLRHRLAEYEKLHERAGPIPACDTGIPALDGRRKRRGQENVGDSANETEQPARKKRRGSFQADGRGDLKLPTTRHKVRFADDA